MPGMMAAIIVPIGIGEGLSACLYQLV